MHIDSQLREEFPNNRCNPFGGRSIILVGDICKFILVKDKPLYVGNTAVKVLWKILNIVVTLDTIFKQQGDNNNNNKIKRLLSNLINTKHFFMIGIFLCHELIRG